MLRACVQVVLRVVVKLHTSTARSGSHSQVDAAVETDGHRAWLCLYGQRLLTQPLDELHSTVHWFGNSCAQYSIALRTSHIV